MRTKLKITEGIFPIPVLMVATYNKDGSVNVMNAAWGTMQERETVDAPVINEFPICLECKFVEYQDNEYGCGVIGKVVNATADESVMVDGKIDMSKANAIAFDTYTHGCSAPLHQNPSAFSALHRHTTSFERFSISLLPRSFSENYDNPHARGKRNSHPKKKAAELLLLPESV